MYASNKQYNKDKFLIESPELYYWLGFLYADGCLIYNQNQYYLNLELSIKDEAHLLNYANYIEYTGNKIYYRTRKPRIIAATGDTICETHSCSLSLNVTDIKDRLLNYGIIPNKTYEWQEPKLDTALVSHYLRGLIDGDGSISLTKCKLKKTFNPVIYIVSKEELSIYLTKTLSKIGYDGTHFIHKIKRTSCQPIERLIFSGRHNITKLANLVNYKNEFRLNRKWQKIEDYVASYNS